MDGSGPELELAGLSTEEQCCPVLVTVPPSPSSSETTGAAPAASPRPADGAAVAFSAPSLSGPTANPDTRREAAAGQRAAEEGTAERSPALDGSPRPGGTLCRTETEPGPSDRAPPGLPQRRTADDNTPRAAVPGPAGPACERAQCGAGAARPCQVHSLPDVRRCRTDCEQAVCSPAPLSPAAAAAASSEPTAGQVAAVRLSATSVIRVALQSTASHTSHASPLSSVGPFCRICHEGESREQLISPCRCAGSVGLVHVSCIEKWLSAANKDSCEICMYRYVTERRPKPLLEWLLNPSNPEDARNLIGDVICFFLLTALAVIAAYLCLMGASHYLSYKTQWEATGLVVLGLLISSIYCVWLVVTCRYHCHVWHDWRRTHQDVHLLEMKRRTHSAVELNNNVPSSAAAAVRCRVCHGGSYSCAHCCAACPHHAVQLDATATDDVFDDGGTGLCDSPPPLETAGREK